MAYTPLGLVLASAGCLRCHGAADGHALQGQLHLPITHLLDVRLISRKIAGLLSLRSLPATEQLVFYTCFFFFVQPVLIRL